MYIAAVVYGDAVGADEHSRRLLLTPSPESASAARRLASELADSWGLADLSADLALVVSELVTNAVLHARTDLEVTVERLADGLRVEVRDGSPAPVRPPVVAPPPDAGPSLLSGDADLDALEELLNTGATTGRGLQLVERLTSSWGSSPLASGEGKVVWADLRPSPSPAVAPPPSRPPAVRPVWGSARRSRPSQPARLVAVPVRLALESAMNLETLLREFQMMDLAGGVPPPAAGLVTAATEIVDRYPELRRSGQDALRLALQRGDRLLDVDLLLPPGAAASLHRLNRLLDEVARYCERGDLLALAPSQELRAFRAWYAEEVERQVGGQPPQPSPFSTVASEDEPPAGGATPLSPRAGEEIERVAGELGRAADARTVIELLLAEAVESLGASSASLSMRVADSDTVEVVDSIGMGAAVADHWRYSSLADDLPASEAIRTGRPIAVRTPSELELRYPLLRDAPVLSDLSFVCVPLAGAGQPASGALNVTFTHSRDFTPADLRLLGGLCRLAAEALERTGAASRDERHREREQLAEAVSAAIDAAPVPNLDARLQVVVAAVANWFGGWCDAFAAPAGDAGGAAPRHVAGSHPDPVRAQQMADVHRRWPPAADAGAVVRCLTTGETVVYQVIPDQLLIRTAHNAEHLEALRRLGFASLAVAPVCEAGDVVAALGVARPEGRYFTDEDVRLVEEVARRAGR